MQNPVTTAMVPYTRRHKRSHTWTLKRGSSRKNLGEDERDRFSRRRPTHLPIQKEAKELLGSFHRDGRAVSQGPPGYSAEEFIFKGRVLPVLIHKFI